MRNSFKGLLGRRFKCKCGRVHFVPPLELYTGKNGISRLLDVVHRIGVGGRVLVVADKNTFRVAGEEVAERLAEDGPSVAVEVYCPAKKEELTAEHSLAEKLAKRMKEKFDFAIAVGSGTINDLTKYAAAKCGIPYIVYATAPSMNGYPSFMAALSYKGIKKSFKARPPVAIIGDIDILSNAPKELIESGLGDGISKSVCNIDWKIAGMLKKEHFCPLPVKLMENVMSFYLKKGPLIKTRNKAVIKRLFEVLNLAGIAMTLAGSTKPASGGEHYISHYLDLFNSIKGKKHTLHGYQVSVATVICTKLYEYLLKLDVEKIDIEKLRKKWFSRRWTKKYFQDFYGAKMSERVRKEFMEKSVSWDRKEKEIRFIMRNWKKIRRTIKDMLVPSQKIISTLKKAGVPVSFSQLGISRREMKDTLLHCREIRSRYIIFDLAYDLGVLEKYTEEYI